MAVPLLHLSTHLGIPPTVLALALVVLLLILYLLRWALCPTLDPREPPMLWPKIPLIGHSLSIVSEGGEYYGRLYKATPHPALTLPTLTQKLYLLNSTTLIAAALRSPTLSFDPFIVLFSRNALAACATRPTCAPFNPSMSGEWLRGVVAVALGEIAGRLNELGVGGGGAGGGDGGVGCGGDGGVCEVGHVGEWLREGISKAVVRALYGSKNPITLGRLYDIWCVFLRVSVAGRGRIQAALYEYYREGHDQGPDVSAFIRNRAAAKRQMGVCPADLASGETDIPWTALTNTIPSLAWVFVSVVARPDFTERVRQETAEATTVDGDKASVNMEELGKKPFINAVVHEVQRMYNKLCGYREVLEDTMLRGADGREYLLKKGSSAQWFHGVPYLSEDIWGPEATVFNPERFIHTPAEEEKRLRGAYIPFSGG
ncbi:hypothetical protein CHGG_03082 [Chaetomium globosum CBS 148.51]|uniref:Cytochrome P450 n=1 Tax=Chaetomium globosum (strain ATCC 6205 / CBS 148.51 / DSM 1962 / NBRC 6347 / NRRL 1970) TaxID=306901 RepID=Q2H9M2_CHAGB|nr:uncharacterized protein CHGG_03082 [Chaetomium globosum CBS 148.51]EAQ91147.1 hypothetical protein CHGG_03082 [Chaetomium globosum CBS 148.51]